MNTIKACFLLLLLFIVSCSTPWYEQYGITDRYELKQEGYAENLIRAMDDENPTVRRSAIQYITRHKSSMLKAQTKLENMAKYDEHNNVRREAEKALAILNSKTATGIVTHSGCSNFTATMPDGVKKFTVYGSAKYNPEGFRPVSGDKVDITYYHFAEKNFLVEISAVSLAEDRIIPNGTVLIGKLEPYSSWKYNSRYPLLLKDGSSIGIDITGAKNTSKGSRQDKPTCRVGAVLKIKIKDHKPGHGACYIYGVKKYFIFYNDNEWTATNK